jgi:glycine/D-amino acid oxidase-like deaminating enzyme
MSERMIHSDVTVIGGGVAGLTTAKMLSEQGCNIVLIEKANTLAAGATTRNEGWLHNGTYHAVAVQDERNARQIVERTRYGHDYIETNIPECIENEQEPMYALIHNDDLVSATERRWESFDIPHTHIPLGKFRKLAPEINIERVAAAFAVEDRSINTRVLCTRLAEDIRKTGGKIFTGTTFTPEDEYHGTIFTSDQERYTISSDLVIVTTGPAIKDFFEKLTGNPFPMRYMKSHLIILPKLVPYGIFYIDPGEAGVMNHSNTSVIGINRDGVPIDSPDYEIIPEKRDLIYDATERLIPVYSKFRGIETTIACIKPDVYNQLEDAVNLNISIGEPIPNYLYAVPGKMTESPYLAQSLVNLAEGRLSRNNVVTNSEIPNYYPNLPINLRPCDRYLLGVN